MKKILLLLIGTALFSCSDFLDTVPKDQLSSSTFWKTETDAYKALVGCYNDWTSGYTTLYWDCTSDFGFNFHTHEGYRVQAQGAMNTDNTGAGFYTYTIIRRCNNFLANVDKITFADPNLKKNYIAQVRTIRAYKYAMMNMWYGGVPLANELYETAISAQLPKNTEAEVYKFVQDELAAAIPDLSKDQKSGFVDKGTALAIKMRSALWMNDYPTALAAANDIKTLGKYELETGAADSYAKLFTTTPTTSKEVIFRTNYLLDVSSFFGTYLYNNVDGGWSSIVPTRNLVETYEMASGLTKDEAGSGYDAAHPFAGRDPRMAMSLIFPGKDWQGRVFNTLDAKIDGKENQDYYNLKDNGSKTALTWGKYTSSKPASIGNTTISPILYRYAEVLLTIAEANIEMAGGDLGLATDMIDQVRTRAGMPVVDRAKYSTQSALRELLRRERAVEFAGEGLRRADIVRWKDASGKLVAETVLTGKLAGYTGTVDMTGANPFMRATINVTEPFNLEDRLFQSYMRYLPFSRTELTNNPKLEQNDGYAK